MGILRMRHNVPAMRPWSLMHGLAKHGLREVDGLVDTAVAGDLSWWSKPTVPADGSDSRGGFGVKKITTFIAGVVLR